jgi:putative oxidoreductase
MDVVVLVGRVLFGALFVLSAFAHLMQTDALAGYAAARGVPMARLATVVSGVQILVGGVFVILGLWGDVGALLLFVFLILTASLMHGFWKETDPQSRQMETVQFNKDVALSGAALITFALFAYAGDDLGLTITGPVFSID